MNFEVIKLTKHTIDGSEKWVIAKEELIKAPDKLLRLKIRDKHQLKKNYGHLKNIIREACGI